MTTIPSLSFSDVILRGFERLKLSPWWVFVVVLAFNVVINFGFVIIFDAWGPVQTRTGEISLGFSQEPAGWAIDFLAQPMVFAMAMWLQNAGEGMMSSLLRDGHVIPHPGVHDALAWGRRKLQSKFLFIAAGITSFVVQSFVVLLETGYLGDHNPTWVNVHPAIFLTRSIVALFAYYFLAVIVFSLAIIIMTLNRIMKIDNVVNIKIYHPDDAGGLGAIGRFMANIGYLVFTFGMVVVMLFVQARIFSGFNTGWLIAASVGLAAYTLVSPVFFLWPLLSTHRAMLKYRDQLLLTISAEINEICHQTIQNKNDDSPNARFTRLKQLEELYKLTQKYPTWPFGTPNLRKYSTLTLSPVLSFVMGLAVNWVYDLIFRS